MDLPRPDKKVAAKKQARVMVDLLRTIAGNAHLRKNKIFVNFLMPDDEFGEFTEADSSEVVGIHYMYILRVYVMLRACMRLFFFFYHHAHLDSEI